MKRILLGLAAVALLGSCEPTTYGQTVQQQKRVEPNPEPAAGAEPTCPTIAREGTTDYERCEVILKTDSEAAPRSP